MLITEKEIIPIQNENYQILIHQLLEEMNESKSTMNHISLKLNKNRDKLIYEITKIINKISYSTIKLKNSCRICKTHYSVIELHKFNELNTQQLKKLLTNIEIYLDETEDYTIKIDTLYLILIFIISIIIPLYIAIYNMYLIQLINYFILLGIIYPTIYTIYQYQGCSKHDKYNTSYTLIDILRMITSGFKKQNASTKHTWSSKYANKLAKYIIEQIKILQNNNI